MRAANSSTDNPPRSRRRLRSCPNLIGTCASWRSLLSGSVPGRLGHDECAVIPASRVVGREHRHGETRASVLGWRAYPGPQIFRAVQVDVDSVRSPIPPPLHCLAGIAQIRSRFNALLARDLTVPAPGGLQLLPRIGVGPAVVKGQKYCPEGLLAHSLTLLISGEYGYPHGTKCPTDPAHWTTPLESPDGLLSLPQAQELTDRILNVIAGGDQ